MKVDGISSLISIYFAQSTVGIYHNTSGTVIGEIHGVCSATRTHIWVRKPCAYYQNNVKSAGISYTRFVEEPRTYLNMQGFQVSERQSVWNARIVAYVFPAEITPFEIFQPWY